MKLIDVLLLDNDIKQKYDEIQSVDTTSYYHGYKHIMNVIATLLKFIQLFNIDEHKADKLLVAVLFHDIGRGKTGKGHELLSADFMKNHLKKYDISKFGFKEEDIDEMYEAIKVHEQKDNLEQLTKFQLLINIVDKLDVTKERINLNNPLNPELPSYKFDVFREIYLDVNAVNPRIEDGSLKLEFECNDNMTIERLYSIPFMQTVDKLHKELASRYGLNAEKEIIAKSDNYSK